MRTNINIDDKLTNEAFALTGLKTKKELVELALQELIRKKRRAAKKGLCGAFEELHKLNINDDPFPDSTRKDRSNPFAEDL